MNKILDCYICGTKPIFKKDLLPHLSGKTDTLYCPQCFKPPQETGYYVSCVIKNTENENEIKEVHEELINIWNAKMLYDMQKNSL